MPGYRFRLPGWKDCLGKLRNRKLCWTEERRNQTQPAPMMRGKRGSREARTGNDAKETARSRFMPWPRHFGECGRCPIHSCFMCFAIFPPNSASGRWRNESAPVRDGISGAGPGCVSPSMPPIAFFRVMFPKNRPIPASCGGVQAETRRDYTRRGRDFFRHGQAGVLSSHDCSPIHCGIREGHGGNISGHDSCCPRIAPKSGGCQAT